MSYLRVFIISVCLLAQTLVWAANDHNTIAVVDFYNASQNEEWNWLSAGLADMLITDMSVIPDMAILDRENLKAYQKELDLDRTGLVDTEMVSRLAKTAKVDKVIFGVYTINSNNLDIKVNIVDISQQKLIQFENTSGGLNEVLSLQKQLSQRIIDRFNIRLSDRETKILGQIKTESLDAAAHFYRGLIHYDKGDIEYALAEARLSQRIDPAYQAAKFWTARLFSELGQHKHAEIEFKRIINNSLVDYRYKLHASLLLAQIYEKQMNTPDLAISILEKTHTGKLDSIEQINVQFRLAQTYFKTKQFDLAYKYSYPLAKISKNSQLSSSYSINYKSVPIKKIDQIRSATVDLYEKSFLNNYYNGNNELLSSEEFKLISPENPIYNHREILAERYRFYNPRAIKPIFYAPKGLRFKSFSIVYKGKHNNIHINPRIYHQSDFSHSFELRTYLPKPVNGKSSQRYDSSRFFARAVTFNGIINKELGEDYILSIHADFIEEDAPIVGSTEYWQKLMSQNLEFPIIIQTPGHDGGSTSLLEDKNEALVAVYDTYRNFDIDENTIDSDIYLSYSNDQKTWKNPSRINRINTSSHEFSPHLTQDDTGRYLLIYVSDRQGPYELWLSTSYDKQQWTRPFRLKLETEEGKELSHLIAPKLFQDNQGKYRLAAFQKKTSQVYLSTSSDLRNWQPAQIFDMPKPEHWNNRASIEYVQDDSSIYRLIISPAFTNHLLASPMILASSYDGNHWTNDEVEIPGDSYPAIVINPNGGYDLLIASDNSTSYFPYQLTSSNWLHWSNLAHLPRINYLTFSQGSKPDMLRDSHGFYWIALHSQTQKQLQLFRLDKFPAINLEDVYIVKESYHPYVDDGFRYAQKDHKIITERSKLNIEKSKKSKREWQQRNKEYRCRNNSQNYGECMDN